MYLSSKHHDDVIRWKRFRVTGHFCGEFTGKFLAQRPVTRSFDVFFDLRLNKWFRKQSWSWWFTTPSHPLWRHRNDCTTYRVKHQQIVYGRANSLCVWITATPDNHWRISGKKSAVSRYWVWNELTKISLTSLHIISVTSWGCTNIAMPSYQYRYYHNKDRYLWNSQHLGRVVSILEKAPGLCDTFVLICPHRHPLVFLDCFDMSVIDHTAVCQLSYHSKGHQVRLGDL